MAKGGARAPCAPPGYATVYKVMVRTHESVPFLILPLLIMSMERPAHHYSQSTDYK